MQNQPVNVTINSTTPDMKVAVMGSRQFSISIHSISELNPSYEPLRTIYLNGLNFTYDNVTTGKNVMYNYSASLENGAILNVLVSLLIFIFIVC